MNLDPDLKTAQTWWTDLVPAMPEDIRGLWFGIGEFGREDACSRKLYVAGTTEFDARDATAEWAVGPTWLIARGYVHLSGLAAIPERDYRSQLEHAVAVVRGLGIEPGSVGRVEGAAVGFDDGDFEIVWASSSTN